jgi:arsenite methyltransferase
MPGPDPWARWVLDRSDHARSSGAASSFLTDVRNRLLDNAELGPADTVVDVGAGDGLIAFGALERLGAAGRVVFVDISSELLDHCRATAEQLGVIDRCAFVEAAAEDLAPLATSSADVVTVRSVLIYVADKAAALAECCRVLRPGGRLSMFEPINRYFGDRRDRMLGLPGEDVAPVADLVDRVFAVYDRLQPPGADPMLNFDDRDLIELAHTAGFDEVHLDLSVDVRPRTADGSWESFAHTPPNPLVPSVAEAAAGVLSPDDWARFETHLRPLFEQGRGVERTAGAYLRARKPAGG